MKYRAEIDGLRTLAVVPVVLFHAGFSIFAGGFVGVDIFFVISGYLITTILIDELDRGEFSILRFYERRARRILPALFIVIACTIPIAWKQLDPARFTDFAQSIIATMAFVSNILFWRESGYFDLDAENKPLLHTWSLAVEEQYYLFFPVMLFLLWRFGRGRTLAVIVALAVASLGIAEWGSSNAPSANFYLLPSRMWELFAGSICAFALPRMNPRGHQGLGALGLVLIVGSIFLIDESRRYPSLITLAPVLGTVLIILFARAGTWAARGLSLRPMVWIGLISYSLYLWHQPIFSLVRMKFGERATLPMMSGLIVLALVLSVLTWRFVEQPFRRGKGGLLPTRHGVFAASALGTVAFMAFGGMGIATNGAAFRYPPGYAALLAGFDDRPDTTCHWEIESDPPQHPVKACLRGPSEHPQVMIFGDSHAWAISEDLADELTKRGISSYIMTEGGCSGIPGLYFPLRAKPDFCAKFNEAALDWARQSGISLIIYASRTSQHVAGGVAFDNGEGGVEPEPETPPVADIELWPGGERPSDEVRMPRLKAAIRDRLAALATEFKLVIVEQIPEAGWRVPLYGLQIVNATGKMPYVSTSYARYHERSDETVAILREAVAMAPPGRARTVRVDDLFCHEDTGRCDNIVDGVPLYFDDDHLSRAGARLIAPRIAEAVAAALAP